MLEINCGANSVLYMCGSVFVANASDVGGKCESRRRMFHCDCEVLRAFFEVIFLPCACAVLGLLRMLRILPCRAQLPLLCAAYMPFVFPR